MIVYTLGDWSGSIHVTKVNVILNNADNTDLEMYNPVNTQKVYHRNIPS